MKRALSMFTIANFNIRPQRSVFTWEIVFKKQAPLSVVGGETEGLRRKELSILDQFLRIFRLNPESPTNPRPRGIIVAGSGTVAGRMAMTISS
jgi:hypothetical protein